MNRSGKLAARAAAIITILYIVLGYSAQIGHTLAQGTSAGLSGVMLVLGLATFGAWTIAGWLMRPMNKEIVVSNGLGVVFALALILVWVAMTR